MGRDFHIRCRTAPCGEHGPLLPSVVEGINILMLHTTEPVSCPAGFTIDGLFTFDMQVDGGLDAVEIFLPTGIHPTARSDFNAGLIPARPREKYWRLFLEPSGEGAESFEVGFEREGGILTFPFGPSEIDAKYLVGPGVTALVGSNELRGFRVDLTSLLALPWKL